MDSAEKSGVGDDWRDSPVHTAAWLGGLCEMQQLIAHENEINAADKYGRTLLALSAASPRDSLLKVNWLIGHGADVGLVGDDGLSALHLASAADNVDVVLSLITAGAQVNAVDKNGNTPCHSACRKGAANALKVLVDAGADASIRNRDGHCPRDVSLTSSKHAIEATLRSQSKSRHAATRGAQSSRD